MTSASTELIVEDGRCTGVVCAGGERTEAREAVLSSIHVKDLDRDGTGRAWDADFRYAIDTYDPGVSAFAAHYATTEPPRYTTHDGATIEAVSAGVAGWPEDFCGWAVTSARAGWSPTARGCCSRPRPCADPTPRAGGPAHGEDPRHAALRPRSIGAQQWEELREEIAAVHLGHLRGWRRT